MTEGNGREIETWAELEAMLKDWLTMRYWQSEEKLTPKVRLAWFAVACVSLAAAIYCMKEVFK